MKKIILMLTAALTFSVASAQECNNDCKCCKKDSTETCCKETKKEMKNKRPSMADMMALKLELSEEQKAKVEELQKKYGLDEQRMPGMRRGPQEPREMRQAPQGERRGPQGNRQEMMEKMKKYNEELKEILTPEQQEKYENMRKARMQRPGGPRR